jgi:hypothetical protein
MGRNDRMAGTIPRSQPFVGDDASLDSAMILFHCVIQVARTPMTVTLAQQAFPLQFLDM